MPELMRRLGISVAVSTYQAGKVILLRCGQGPLNTHFRSFAKPMGIAAAGGRLAVGTANELVEFHNVPAVCAKLDAADSTAKHDACFLPRVTHLTGDVQIHELAWAGENQDELWFVNTRFSCLCTRSDRYSFLPRWRPPFVTHLAPEDRCHLNGLGLRDRRPRYITALGATNEPRGWRNNKRNGGILMDIADNRILCGNLSMPHSPRWHEGRVWVLQSGQGSIGYLDNRGNYQTVAELPGFTRGLDFHGPFAFVGLSQVRETAVFSGIAIAEKPQEQRYCGVWVIDTRNGATVGFVKFEEGVQEIFAVQVLASQRWPDLINDDPAILSESFILPDDALAEVRA
jgi:uncharacterized protein (TIGR03032 family)